MQMHTDMGTMEQPAPRLNLDKRADHCHRSLETVFSKYEGDSNWCMIFELAHVHMSAPRGSGPEETDPAHLAAAVVGVAKCGGGQ